MQDVPVLLNSKYLDNIYILADRIIDPVIGTVTYQDSVKPIRRKQLELLALLASANGRMVHRDDFIAAFWHENEVVGHNGLSRAMAYLRSKISDSDKENPVIRTIPRQGYQLNFEVKFANNLNPITSDSRLSVAQQIKGKPKWQLLERINQSTASETWTIRIDSGEIKVIRFCLKEQHLKGLRHEIKVLSHLKETLKAVDTVITVEQWQLDEPLYYLTMPYTAHGDLMHWSETVGGLSTVSIFQRLKLMKNWSEALHQVHNAGVVHQNLSADSLFIDEKAGAIQGKLGEFGLGDLAGNTDKEAVKTNQVNSEAKKTFTETITTSGELSEKTYQAPELSLGESSSFDTDIYALGVLFYQLIVGDLKAVFNRHWREQITEASLQNLITQMTHNQINRRPSADKVSAIIAEVLSDYKSKKTDSKVKEHPSNHKNITKDKYTFETLGNKKLSNPNIPQSIGPFRLLEKLGEGGMGKVYLAEQREPIEREVALKVIKAGLDSDQILARFEAERQALAMMNHVNVAAVFETGKNNKGQPYFAMEYVPGKSITYHCDHAQLDIDARIKLFLQVCDGVLHAHQKGIIHRDLSPSNILVKTQTDTEPTVKIIDFGVAKSLQSKLSTHTLHTQIGSFVGTPRYASPEQIGGQREKVDTRTDVYSLGVILYELLVGITPLSTESLHGLTSIDLLELLNNNHAPAPCERLDDLNEETLSKIATCRSVSIKNLKKTISREITWVLLKCLELDPDDRYISVFELKRDLTAWMNSQPVEARKTNAWYRVKKSIKRNKLLYGSALAACLILVSTITIAIMEFVSSQKSEAQANMAKNFYQKQLFSIEPDKMSEDLQAMLADKTNHKQINHTDIVLALLNKHVFKPNIKTIKEDYQNYPELQASLYFTTGDTLEKLGISDNRLFVLDQALKLREQVLGSNHPETLKALVSRSVALYKQGDWKTVEETLFNKLFLENSITNKDTVEYFDLINVYLISLLSQNKIDEAGKVLPLQMYRARESLGKNHTMNIVLTSNYAHLLNKRGEFDISLPIFKDALRMIKQAKGENYHQIAGLLESIGHTLMSLERYDEAKIYLQESIEFSENKYGINHLQTIHAKFTFALYLEKTGQLTESTQELEKIYQTSHQHLGEYHHETLNILRSLNKQYNNNANHEPAFYTHQFSIDRHNHKYGTNHEFTAIAYHDFAEFHEQNNNHIIAQSYYKKALESYSNIEGQYADEISYIKKQIAAYK